MPIEDFERFIEAFGGVEMGIKTFELDEISVQFDPRLVYRSWKHSMEWLLEEDEEFDLLDAVGGNREFTPMDPIGFDSLKNLFEQEKKRIRLLELDDITEEEITETENEFHDDENWWPHLNLDVGVRSTVMALLEIGCYPFSSCNGGSFSNKIHHMEHYPLVAMYGDESVLGKVEVAAKSSGCGLHWVDDMSGMGALVLYTNDIRRFIDFASVLIASLAEKNQIT